MRLKIANIKNQILIIVLLVAGVGLLAYFLFSGQPSQVLPEPASQKEQQPQETNQEEQIEEFQGSPSQVVERFIQKFSEAAPPTADERAGLEAMSLISASTRADIAIKGSNAAALSDFTGIQDIPQQGWEVTREETDESTSEVDVLLHYADGDMTKTFYLSQQDGIWKIIDID